VLLAAWDAMDWPADSNDPPSSLLLNRPSCSTQKKTPMGRSDGRHHHQLLAPHGYSATVLLSQATPISVPKDKQVSDTAAAAAAPAGIGMTTMCSQQRDFPPSC